MIYASYDVFSCKDVPFGGCIDTATRLGGQIASKPQSILGVNTHFSAKYSNFHITKSLSGFQHNFVR